MPNLEMHARINPQELIKQIDDFDLYLNSLHEKIDGKRSENEFDFDLEHLYEKLMNNQTEDPFDSTTNSPKQYRRTFPNILYELLQQNKDSDIISWYPDGKGFKIHKAKEFEKYFLPIYFRQTKIRSFHRQINIYGYKRIGEDKFEHIFFIRDKPQFLAMIQRTPIKNDSNHTRSNVL